MTKQERELRERMMAVKAMEYLARQVNDEDVFDIWLMGGVADGDIEYGDFTIHSGVETDPAYEYASDSNTFSYLMGCFLRTMSAAYKNGGLWCGGIVSDN